MKTEWIYGVHTATQYLEQHPHRIKQAFIQKTKTTLNPRLDLLHSDLKAQGIATHFMRAEKLNELTQGANHQGIALEVLKTPSTSSLKHFLEELTQSGQPLKSLLVLDRIVDPQNLGACFRVAHAAGMDAILATRWQSAELTPAVRKISCGASEQLPFLQVSNLSEVLRKLKEQDFFCIGLDAQASHSIYQLAPMEVQKNIALVLGSERSGIREHVAKQCDWLCKIPMQPQAESLNVAMAAAIACFEMRRQRALL